MKSSPQEKPDNTDCGHKDLASDSPIALPGGNDLPEAHADTAHGPTFETLKETPGCGQPLPGIEIDTTQGCPGLDVDVANQNDLTLQARAGESDKTWTDKNGDLWMNGAKVKEPDKKPDDDDDAPRYYEKSQKHPDYKTVEDIEKFFAKGMSPSPQKGQATLNVSIKTGDGARVATQNGYIVIFLRTGMRPQGGSVYHGFLTTYKDLEQRKRAALIDLLVDSGLIKRNGKIL